MWRAARSPVTPDGAAEGPASGKNPPLQNTFSIARSLAVSGILRRVCHPRFPMRIAAIVLATAALIAVLVIGLSQAGSQGGKPKRTKAPTGHAAQLALRGSPPKLA